MISILIDAAVPMYLLKAVSGQEVGFLAAFGVAIAAAIVTSLLTFGLMLLMGIGGIVVAAVLVAALLGLAVAMLFGVELKRAILIGVIFMVVHVGVGVGFELLHETVVR